MLYLSVKRIIYVPYLYPDLIEVIFDKVTISVRGFSSIKLKIFRVLCCPMKFCWSLLVDFIQQTLSTIRKVIHCDSCTLTSANAPLLYSWCMRLIIHRHTHLHCKLESTFRLSVIISICLLKNGYYSHCSIYKRINVS